MATNRQVGIIHLLQLHWHPPNPENLARNLTGAGLGKISKKWLDSRFAVAEDEIQYNRNYMSHDMILSHRICAF